MKKFANRIIAAAAVSCLALTSFVGCSNNNNSDSNDSNGESNKTAVDNMAEHGIEVVTNESGNMVQIPFVNVEPDKNGKVSIAPGMDVNAPDSVMDPDAEPSTSYVAVVDDKGQPVTEYVPITEANGEQATEAGGKLLTTAIPVTTVVTSPAGNNDASDYVSNTKSMYSLWIDITDNVDYVFNDQFIKLTFKVKEDAPAKDYTIAIEPDLSNRKGQSQQYNATVLNGTIRVGSDIEPQDVSSYNNLVVYADNMSANPGDTIDYYINMKNNPGLVAVMLWFSYDSNALEFVRCQPAGEFANITSRTKVGTKAASAE